MCKGNLCITDKLAGAKRVYMTYGSVDYTCISIFIKYQTLDIEFLVINLIGSLLMV